MKTLKMIGLTYWPRFASITIRTTHTTSGTEIARRSRKTYSFSIFSNFCNTGSTIRGEKYNKHFYTVLLVLMKKAKMRTPSSSEERQPRGLGNFFYIYAG